MNVLVSGATGLVGSYVVEGLVGGGYTVTPGGRAPPKATSVSQNGGAAIRTMVNLTLDPDADQQQKFAGIDAFIHLAFDHAPGRYRGGEGDNPQRFRRLNLDGSIRLFEQAKAAGVKRCIFLSSRAVYDGLPPGTVLSQTMTLAPDSLYGQIKIEAEQALAQLSSPDFVTVSLRATGVYGDHWPNKWEGLFADYRAERPLPCRAGSEVHGADVTAAIRLLLQADGEIVNARAFNISDIVTDGREILSVYAQASNSHHPLPATADREGLNVMDTTRLATLGWRPGGHSLLVRTIASLASGKQA